MSSSVSKIYLVAAPTTKAFTLQCLVIVKAFTAREMENDDDYSSGDTFFLPASAERPKSRLEQL